MTEKRGGIPRAVIWDKEQPGTMLTNLHLRSPLTRYLLCNEPASDPAGGTGGGLDDVERAKRQGIEEGRRKAERDLAADLGIPVSEAKQKLADLAAVEAARKDDLTRAQEEATNAKGETATERGARLKAEATLANTLALAKGSLNIEHLDDALRLLDVAEDATDEDRTAAVEALKARMPLLFTAPAGSTTPPPGVPPARQKPPAGGGTPQERAAARAAKARPLRPASAA